MKELNTKAIFEIFKTTPAPVENDYEYIKATAVTFDDGYEDWEREQNEEAAFLEADEGYPDEVLADWAEQYDEEQARYGKPEERNASAYTPEEQALYETMTQMSFRPSTPEQAHKFIMDNRACGIKEAFPGARFTQEQWDEAAQAFRAANPDSPTRDDHRAAIAYPETYGLPAGAHSAHTKHFYRQMHVQGQKTVAEVEQKTAEGWGAKFESFSDMAHDSTRTKWIIKEKLPPGGVSCLYAESTGGKTLVAVDLALSLAAGLPGCILGEFNRPDIHEPQHVIYVALEGGDAFKRYLRGWHALHPEVATETLDKYLKVLDGGKGHRILMDLINRPKDAPPVDRDKAYSGFLKYLDETIIKERGEKPALIVFDTQRYFMAAADENSNNEVGQMYIKLQGDFEPLGIHALVLHHTGKTKDNGPIGASAIKANVLTQLTIKGSGKKDGVREVYWEKTKGSADGMSDPFVIRANPDRYDVMDPEWDDPETWKQGTIAGAYRPDAMEIARSEMKAQAVSVEAQQNFVTKFKAAGLRASEGYTQSALIKTHGVLPGSQKLAESKDLLARMVQQGLLTLTEGKYRVTDRLMGS